MENEKLESFNFNEIVAGVEHDYRVTMDDNRFGIEKDGLVIAYLQHNEVWTQIEGETLPKEVVDKLGDRIEDHWD